jgi:hypothetical protein
MADPTPADRLALAVCRGGCPIGGPCLVYEAICSDCRRDAAAVVRELAKQTGSAKHWHVDQLSAIAAELEEPND